MSDIDFTNLNIYQNMLGKILTGIYDEKQNVNSVSKLTLSTHVTAEDLNNIQIALTGLASNVSAINSYLIDANLNTNQNSTNVGVSNSDFYSSYNNAYLRKNQLVIDGNVTNDSTIYLDNTYARVKNIFVDDYKMTPTSPYNLVSYHTFNERFTTVLKNLNEVQNGFSTTALQNYITGITVNPVDNYLTTSHHLIVNSDLQHTIDITSIFTDLSANVDANLNMWGGLILTYKVAPVWANMKRIEQTLYDYGMRLLGQGYKVYNKSDIIDPQYREYKWFRTYHKNNIGLFSSLTTLFDPKITETRVLGNDFPISTSITISEKNNSITNDNERRFDVYTFASNSMLDSWHDVVTEDRKEYPNENVDIFIGRGKTWMEAGGQQRVYAEVKEGSDGGKYVFFTPSTILFPIPFAQKQALDIQVTLKRDINQPFPGIVPVAVHNEDTYFFDIIGGAQGIPNTNDVQYRELLTIDDNWDAIDNLITIDGVERNVVWDKNSTTPRFYYYTGEDGHGGWTTEEFTTFLIILDGNGNKHYFTKILEPSPTGFFYVKWEAKGMYAYSGIPQDYYLTVDNFHKMHDMYWITQDVINPHFLLTSTDPLASFTTDEDFQNSVVNTVINTSLYAEFITTLIEIINEKINTERILGDTKLSSLIKDSNKVILDGFGLFPHTNGGYGLNISGYNVTSDDYYPGWGQLELRNINGWDSNLVPADVIAHLTTIREENIVDPLISGYLKKLMSGHGWDKTKVYEYYGTSASTNRNDYFWLSAPIILPASLAPQYVIDGTQLSTSEYYQLSIPYTRTEKYTYYDGYTYRLRSACMDDTITYGAAAHPLPIARYEEE